MRLLKWKSLLNLLSLNGIRVLVAASAMLGSTLILYSGYSLYEQIYTENRAFSSGSLAYDNGASIEEVQESLVEASKDYRAWIQVNDTHIDYPVMQAKDDLYYANHDVDGKSSLTGAIYMAAANSADLSDNYIVLFGHHMDNGAMFGDIDRFENEAFFKSHREGVLVYPNGSYDLYTIAVLSTDAYENMIYSAGSRNLAEILAYADAHAIVKDLPDAADVTKLIALSTCASARTNGRLVVLATLTPTKELPTPTPTEEPTDTPTPTPTATPEVTKGPNDTPTPIPTATPKPTEQAGQPTPTGAPVVTDMPSVTPTPDVTESPSVTPTPDVTEAPTETPTPTAEPPKFTATPTPPPTKQADREKTWLEKLIDFFTPGGSSYGEEVWGLLNLICLIVTLYVLAPIFRLRAKYGRIGKMRELNNTVAASGSSSGSLPYDVKKFATRFTVGVAIEAVLSITAVVVYLKTQKMNRPMVLIDKWTPIMLVLLIGSCVAELLLTRYRAGGASSDK